MLVIEWTIKSGPFVTQVLFSGLFTALQLWILFASGYPFALQN